jgi:hypothetical protein
LRRRRQPEAALQRALIDHLRWRAPSEFAFHVPNGGWRSPVEAAILKGQGVRPGVPDLVVIKDGLPFALELKAEGGRLSAAQSEALEAMRTAGGGLWIGVWHPFVSGRLSRWLRIEKMIDYMLKTGDVWFARLEDIAGHIQKMRKDGAYEARVDKLPYYKDLQIPSPPPSSTQTASCFLLSRSHYSHSVPCFPLLSP